jgi:hypothetical protein
MANKRLLLRAWLGFERLLIPSEATEFQRAEMQKAFFGGAACLRRLFWMAWMKSFESTALISIKTL